MIFSHSQVAIFHPVIFIFIIAHFKWKSLDIMLQRNEDIIMLSIHHSEVLVDD